MTDNFSFGHQSTNRSSPSLPGQEPGQPLQLQEGSSSSCSSAGKRQRIEMGMEGDSSSVNSRGYRGVGGTGGSSGYTRSASSGPGGSSSSAGASSGGGTDESRGGEGTPASAQAKKDPHDKHLRSLEVRYGG